MNLFEFQFKKERCLMHFLELQPQFLEVLFNFFQLQFKKVRPFSFPGELEPRFLEVLFNFRQFRFKKDAAARLSPTRQPHPPPRSGAAALSLTGG